MNDILRSLTLPLIALALFVVPGEARAWVADGFTPAVYSNLFGTCQYYGPSGCGSRNPSTFPLNLYTKNYVLLYDGTANPLFPGSTVIVDILPMTTYEIYPGDTKYSYYSCKTSNASAASYQFFNPDPSKIFCMLSLIFDPYAWGSPYGFLTDRWSYDHSRWPASAAVVIAPTPTITSSNPAVVSCTGTSCAANSIGSATITVDFPATVSRQYESWGLYDGSDVIFDFKTWGGMPDATVPANSVSIPVTVSDPGVVLNQAPVASISVPIPGVLTTTEGTPLLFVGSGVDPDGSVVAYEWTYGSCGSTGTLISSLPSFDLNTVVGFPLGTSNIFFRVQDNQGRWSGNCPARNVTVNPAPLCSALMGTSCTSAVNACGSNTGIYQCDGICSVSAPVVPVNYGFSCTSAANMCGMTNSGTILCSGSCSASTPAESSCPVTVPVCPNTTCEAGESPLTCPQDCKVKFKQF